MLPDLLRADLCIVFCGSAAGAASAARGAYYAGPGNRFWSILAKTGLTPRRLQPEEFPLLLSFGIGLTDVVKTVSGADVELRAHAFDRARLLASMRQVQPGCLAFNGKQTARIAFGMRTGHLPYGPAPALDGIPFTVVLPSTSGAASGFWDSIPWFDLARRLRTV